MHTAKIKLVCLLLSVLCLLCSCRQNPTEEQLFARLLDHFQSRGFTCTLQKMEDQQRDVPIYKASVWQSLLLDGTEEVLVYFDESNRADYLSAGIDSEAYGLVTRFGLRFVLVYSGQDEAVLSALKEIPAEL